MNKNYYEIFQKSLECVCKEESNLLIKKNDSEEKDKKDEIVRSLFKHYLPLSNESFNAEEIVETIPGSAHLGKRLLDDAIINKNFDQMGKQFYGLNLHWFLEDMARNLVTDLRDYNIDNKKNRILIIDDNLTGEIEKKYSQILEILTYKKSIELKSGSKFNRIQADGINNKQDIVKFLSYLNDDYNKKESRKISFNNKTGTTKDNIIYEFELRLKNYRYIFTDLLIGDKLLGLNIIKRLTEIQEYEPEKYKYEIITVSRSTNTEDIQKALNFGASFYIPKERIFSIPYRLAQLGKDYPKFISEGNSFRNLNKLPRWKRKNLQTEFLKFDEDYKWIKILPKADLHCHLGGYLDATITLELSMYTVIQTLTAFKLNSNFELDNINEMEISSVIDTKNLKFTCENDFKSLKNNNKLNEMLFEIYEQGKIFRKYAEEINNFSNKSDKRFTIKDKIKKLRKIKSPEKFFNFISDNYYSIRPYQVTALFNCFLSKENEKNDEDFLTYLFNGKFTTKYLEKLIQATHGNQIENSIGGISLESFLKGCDYTGSDIMQTKNTISRAIQHICRKAKDDNLFYLSLRVTPLNFTKGGLSKDEVWDAICEGYNDFKKEIKEDEGYFLILTIIIALKRHYAKSEIKKNVKFGIDNRLDSKDYNSFFYNDMLSDDINPFVCGFDLTGLETGNDPKQFRDDFIEIFESCMPITIHAGEETKSKKIWEAAYELHADRIGHGLSLSDPDANKLRDRFKDFDISIELCPSSNFLTQEGFIVSKKETESKKYYFKQYPSSVFLENNLHFVVCTDDPAVQNTDLSTEYLWLSEMTFRDQQKGITQWETLSLVRNGFKYCFLPYEIKSKLLRIIDHKVYKLLEGE